MLNKLQDTYKKSGLVTRPALKLWKLFTGYPSTHNTIKYLVKVYI